MSSRRTPFLMLALTATVSASLACSGLRWGAPLRSTPGTTPQSAEPDEQPPLQPGDGQTRDDALADQGAWTLSGYDLNRYGPIGDITFEGGRVVLTGLSEYAWAWAVYADTFAGVTASVDVTKLADSDASPGLICNYRSEQEFYYATVGGFGVYTVNHFTDGLYETVLEGGSSQTGPVLPDGQTNRVELTCADDQISLSVNGEALGSAPAPSGGQIGLMLETFSDAVTDARFESLVIRVTE